MILPAAQPTQGYPLTQTSPSHYCTLILLPLHLPLLHLPLLLHQVLDSDFKTLFYFGLDAELYAEFLFKSFSPQHLLRVTMPTGMLFRSKWSSWLSLPMPK